MKFVKNKNFIFSNFEFLRAFLSPFTPKKHWKMTKKAHKTTKRGIFSRAQFSRQMTKKLNITPFYDSLGMVLKDFRKWIWLTFKSSLKIALNLENANKKRLNCKNGATSPELNFQAHLKMTAHFYQVIFISFGLIESFLGDSFKNSWKVHSVAHRNW